MKKEFTLFIVLVFSWLGINMTYPVEAATNQQANTAQDRKNKKNANEEKSSLKNKHESESTAKTKQKSALKDRSADNNSTANGTEQKDKEGWIKKGQRIYYYKDNIKVKGLVEIQGYYYLFSKKGTMLTGLRKTPQKKAYSYYLPDGKRSEKSVATNRAFYWIKQGIVTGIKNKAECISQRPEMPTGCEITAVTMMINFAGVKVSKFAVANKTPRSRNPDKGFIGSPFKAYPGGYWISPLGIKSVVKDYLGKAQVLTGCSLQSLKNKLLHSHLVVVWVSGIDGFSNHALTLTGYHRNKLYYNDPWNGKKAVITSNSFINHWREDGYGALSY